MRPRLIDATDGDSKSSDVRFSSVYALSRRVGLWFRYEAKNPSEFLADASPDVCLPQINKNLIARNRPTVADGCEVDLSIMDMIFRLRVGFV